MDTKPSAHFVRFLSALVLAAWFRLCVGGDDGRSPSRVRSASGISDVSCQPCQCVDERGRQESS